MKRLLSGIALILTISCLYGQTKTDSLILVWNDTEQADTARLEATRKLYSVQYLYTQPDSAIYWAEQSYAFAASKGIKTYMASALQLKGVVAKNAGDLDEAIEFLKQSLELIKEDGSPRGILATTASIANVYARKHDYANAINYDLQALKIGEQLGQDFYLTGMLNNIGTTYMDLKDYENALEYFNRAVDIHQESSQERAKVLEGITLVNIGSVFSRQKVYDSAIDYFQKALIANEKYDRKDGEAVSHFSLGEVYFELENIEKAKHHFTESLKLHEQSNDTKAVANCLTYFGRIYQKTKPDSSFVLTQKALEMAQASEAADETSKAAEVLSELYESKGKYQEALDMHKLFRDMRDSVSSETNRNAVLRAEYQYEYDKKILEEEIEYEQQVRKQELRMQRWIGGIGFLLLLAGFYIKSRYEHSIAEREKLLREIELLKERLAAQSVTTTTQQKELSLDRAKLEEGIDAKIGESSWMILNLIFQNPSISNKAIAESVNLSLEGVSSSLRRMYVAFGITAPSNKKIALVMKAVRMSLEG